MTVVSPQRRKGARNHTGALAVRYLSFAKNSAAPAASPAAPPRSWALVAPARIVSDTTIGEQRHDRAQRNHERRGADETFESRMPQPQRRRASAGVGNEPGDSTCDGQHDERSRQRKPQSHKRRENDRVGRRAILRVNRAENSAAARHSRPGRRACASRSAPRRRLLPVIETTDPALMTSAPAPPMNSSDASASGVFDAGKSGSVPRATICASVMTAVTARIVATNANGRCLRGLLASPAGTPMTS